MKTYTIRGGDSSFEFKGTKSWFIPTIEMCKKWRALGFLRCWICYQDDTEIYCSLIPISIGKRKRRHT